MDAKEPDGEAGPTRPGASRVRVARVFNEYKEEAIYVAFVLMLLWGLSEVGSALF
ncbi:hypothetical protein ACFQH6_00980 [Halobacteriaceae archaeon GCM10025711]